MLAGKSFEITSLKLEELESDIKKPFIVKARDKLRRRREASDDS